MRKRFVSEAPLVASVDVLVCGGGPAGIGAAVAAARQGASTILIEQQGCLGGVATNTLVGVWLGSYSRDGAYPVVGGIFREIVDRLTREGAAIPAEEDVPPQFSLAERKATAAQPASKFRVLGSRHVGYAPWHGRAVAFEFEPCKRICEELVQEAGVRIRYFTSFVAPDLKENELQGVYVFSKSGLEYIEAKVVVDATGDADVAFRSGCPTAKGRAEDGLMSPATLILVLEDVDSLDFERYCKQTGDVRLRSIIEGLKNQGKWPFPFEVIICCEMPRRGRFFINTLRLTGIDGTEPDDLTRGMIEGRKQAKKLLEILRQYVPGFAKARLVQTSPVLGIRDTRRIVGEHVIRVEDIIQGRHYEDTVALSGYQWDMADPKRPSSQRMEGKLIGLPYVEIPYRSLLPQGLRNLLVAGRCISCEWDALGPTRTMPVCFAMGQAAGTAVALSLANGGDVHKVDFHVLQETLVKQGAILPQIIAGGG